jgi:hypothetical protein
MAARGGEVCAHEWNVFSDFGKRAKALSLRKTVKLPTKPAQVGKT